MKGNCHPLKFNRNNWNWNISPAPSSSRRLKFKWIRAIGNPVSLQLFGELQLFFPLKKPSSGYGICLFWVFSRVVGAFFCGMHLCILRAKMPFLHGDGSPKGAFCRPSSSFSGVKKPFFAANLSEREPV